DLALLADRQALQLLAQIQQQGFLVLRLAHAKAHATLGVRRLRERTQIEADDGAFEPALRGVDDVFVGRRCHSPMSSFHSCGFSRISRSINSMQRGSSSTVISTPRLLSNSSSPMKLLFSPTTTRGM